MTRFGPLLVGLSLCAALAAPMADAKPKAKHPLSAGSCCFAMNGTVVEVELADQVSTKRDKAGDTFGLRLAVPLVVDGQIVIPADTEGEGEVIQSSGPGLGGKAAKMVLAAKYLEYKGRRIALHGLQLSAAGKANVMASQAVGIAGIGFAPLGIVAFAVRGGDVEFPAGTHASAKLSQSLILPALGPAPREAVADSKLIDAPDSVVSLIAVPPPPPHMGQVVFFRKKSLMGTGQWFNVRENGEALGRLDNGAYFIQAVEPGLHTYTAKTEPEFKDSLKLKVDAGETYFVEGVMTKGVVIGVADLTPSDRTDFAAASKDLKLAAAPSQDKADLRDK